MALTLLPAAVRIEPAVTAPVLKEAGKVRLNCILATEAEPGLNVMGKLTVAPAAPEAVPTDRVGAVTAGGGGGGGGGGGVAVVVAVKAGEIAPNTALRFSVPRKATIWN